MLVISSREFRDKQAEYMDRADRGEQIIVQRGRNKAYSIIPMKPTDIYINTQLLSGDFLIDKPKKYTRGVDKLKEEARNGLPELKF